VHTHRADLARGSPQPGPRVADVIRVFEAECRRRHVLTAEQLRVLAHIRMCHTPALGGHLEVCEECGLREPVYHGCRDRHCPSCQSLAQAQWVEQRTATILPIPHFHVVFTLPAHLRPIIRANRERLFNTLFETASSSLLRLGRDPEHLGAQLGLTAVLHTWTRQMHFHPHLHCIVTGGGLSTDGSSWLAPRSPQFLLPVHVIGALFRHRFLSALSDAHRRGQLRLAGACARWQSDDAFRQLLAELEDVSWVTFAQAPESGPAHLIQYLGRYTYRVAMSDQRLVHVDSHSVTFRTKDGNTCTLDGPEFVYRFAQHVLPRGFVKIRHYGLYASGNVRTRLAKARALLDEHHSAEPEQLAPPSRSESSSTAPEVIPSALVDSGVTGTGTDEQLPAWQTALEQLTGQDLSRCPRCHSYSLRRLPLPAAAPPPSAARCRSPPSPSQLALLA